MGLRGRREIALYQLPHGDRAMRCGFGVKSHAGLKNGSSFRLAIFLLDLHGASARLSTKARSHDPVTALS